jgi:hypothetical protein
VDDSPLVWAEWCRMGIGSSHVGWTRLHACLNFEIGRYLLLHATESEQSTCSAAPHCSVRDSSGSIHI